MEVESGKSTGGQRERERKRERGGGGDVEKQADKHKKEIIMKLER